MKMLVSNAFIYICPAFSM